MFNLDVHGVAAGTSGSSVFHMKSLENFKK